MPTCPIYFNIVHRATLNCAVPFYNFRNTYIQTGMANLREIFFQKRVKPLGALQLHCGEMYWVKLAEDRVRAWRFINTAIKLLVPLRMLDC
jgi:hypothetical protein